MRNDSFNAPDAQPPSELVTKAIGMSRDEAYRQGFLAGARAMQEAAASLMVSADYNPVGLVKAIRALDPEKVGG